MNYFWNMPMFAHMSELDQVSLSDFCQMQDVSPGESVFHKGDDPQALYIVLSGEFEVEKPDGSKVVLEPGDIFWEMALYGQDHHRNATVTSPTGWTLITLLQFSLDQMLQKYPALHDSLTKIIDKRMQENNKGSS